MCGVGIVRVHDFDTDSLFAARFFSTARNEARRLLGLIKSSTTETTKHNTRAIRQVNIIASIMDRSPDTVCLGNLALAGLTGGRKPQRIGLAPVIPL